MDIYFYEAFEEEAEAFRTLIGKKFTYEMTDKTIQETGHRVPPAQLISIRTQSHIPADWSNKISGVLSRSTGYDHLIAFKKATQTTIPCGYLDEYATRAVAEHAILMMMSLFRKLASQIRKFDTFNRDDITGMECRGRNLLVVGVGRIGSEIVEIGRGLGMNIRGVDIVPDKRDVQYVSPKEGIPWADVIICSMNLTADNHNYFNYELLSKAHRGTLFVNIARGEHSPLPGLHSLLKEKHLGGVGLDVFENEGKLAVALRTGNGAGNDQVGVAREMLTFPNVIMTPHNAFNTVEAVERKVQMSVDQIIYFLEHKNFEWQVR